MRKLQLSIFVCITALLPCCLYAEDGVATVERGDSACMAIAEETYEPEVAACEYMESTAPMATSEQDMSIMLSKKYKDKPYKNTKYWKRHNTFKILGWSFLGVGVPAMAVGYCLFFVSAFGDDDEGGAWGAVTFCTGAALTLTSIPMFILSATNKHKAKKVSIGYVPLADHCSGRTAPGLSLAMTF